MRVLTLNVNGIRSAAQKGFFEWLQLQNVDVACLQEVRAQEDQITDAKYRPHGYHCVYVAAQKKGYSGVAIYSRQKPEQIIPSLGYPLCDTEGRYVEIQFPHVNIASLYVPSGTSGDERQREKYAFMDFYYEHLEKRRHEKTPLIIASDINIAHTIKDIKNWKANQTHTGFLPEERAWMDKVLTKAEYVDTFRYLHPDLEQYTWWSHRGRARENNVGWRIDYQLVTPNLKHAIQKASIFKDPIFSDHAPMIVDYDIE